MPKKPHRSFGFTDFVWRLAAALVLVFATFNPSGHSYYHWASAALSGEGLDALHYFLGVLLLACWVAFVLATHRSLDTLGMVILAALVGTGIWLLVDVGVIHADSTKAITWLALVAVAVILAVGMSWSHIWRRMTGQLDVDDVDD